MSAESKNRYITLSNGKKMPILGLGTWKSKPNQVHDAVIAAVEVGYRHIDTAQIYGNEAEIGVALKELFAKGTVKRKDIFVTTKLAGVFHDPSRVKRSLELSLKALQLDYVDLFLMHSPQATKFTDENTRMPIGPDKVILLEEKIVHFVDTWKAMELLVKGGMTKSIGLSNFNESQLDAVLMVANVECVVNQIENHPCLDQKALIAFCKSKNVAVTSYSPLGSPDRVWSSDKDPELLTSPLVKEIAEARGCTVGQLLVAYHLNQGLICVPKSVTPSRIQENFLSLDVQLTDEDIKRLDSLACNFRAVPWSWFAKHPHYPFKDRTPAGSTFSSGL